MPKAKRRLVMSKRSEGNKLDHYIIKIHVLGHVSFPREARRSHFSRLYVVCFFVLFTGTCIHAALMDLLSYDGYVLRGALTCWFITTNSSIGCPAS